MRFFLISISGRKSFLTKTPLSGNKQASCIVSSMSSKKSLARELGKDNIRVNAVAPGIIRTDMVAALPESMIAPMVAAVPLGRIGEPSDIANAFLFLASDLASYVTGEILSVDGAAMV